MCSGSVSVAELKVSRYSWRVRGHSSRSRTGDEASSEPLLGRVGRLGGWCGGQGGLSSFVFRCFRDAARWLQREAARLRAPQQFGTKRRDLSRREREEEGFLGGGGFVGALRVSARFHEQRQRVSRQGEQCPSDRSRAREREEREKKKKRRSDTHSLGRSSRRRRSLPWPSEAQRSAAQEEASTTRAHSTAAAQRMTPANETGRRRESGEGKELSATEDKLMMMKCRLLLSPFDDLALVQPWPEDRRAARAECIPLLEFSRTSFLSYAWRRRKKKGHFASPHTALPPLPCLASLPLFGRRRFCACAAGDQHLSFPLTALPLHPSPRLPFLPPPLSRGSFRRRLFGCRLSRSAVPGGRRRAPWPRG